MDQYPLRPSAHGPLRTPSNVRGMTPTSPQERPGSSGYAEPRSHHLHQALKERRGLVTPQPQQTFSSPTQTTPHRGTPSRRPSTGRATPFRDEWTAAAGQVVQRSQSTGPRMRARRLSESATTGRPTDTPKAGLTIKESNVLIDRLQKENFDLKLRMTLQEEKVKKMSKELQDMQERVDMADQLAERCASAEEMASQLEDQLEQVRARFEETWSHNQELVAISDDLTRELIERDGSIDEAAQIIHELEQRIHQLEEQQAQTPSAKPLGPRVNTHPDSDYFSGEAESPVVVPTKLKGRPSSSSSSSIMPADSDYYSATSYSSPASAVPKKARPSSRRMKSSPTDPAANGFRRRANSDQTADTAVSFDLDGVHPYDGRRSSTVKPPTTLQPAASIQSSPDPPIPRPGLRRTRKGHAAVIQSLRLQVEQQQQQQPKEQAVADPTTPRASYFQNTPTPGSAPLQAAHAAASAQRRVMHSATPVQHLRASSEPPVHDWTGAMASLTANHYQAQLQQQQQQQGTRPLRSLYMTGELSRPVTSDTHNHYGDITQLRIPGQAPAEATPTVLSPAATPANDHSDNDDSGASTSRPSTTIAAGTGTNSPAAAPASSAAAAAATLVRPIIWRDRSNMSSLALAATNAAARLQRGPLVADDDASDSGSGSPTATIPETISSRLDLAGEGEAAKRARRLGELGSEYSLVSMSGSGSGYGGLFGRDVLFRP